MLAYPWMIYYMCLYVWSVCLQSLFILTQFCIDAGVFFHSHYIIFAKVNYLISFHTPTQAHPSCTPVSRPCREASCTPQTPPSPFCARNRSCCRLGRACRTPQSAPRASVRSHTHRRCSCIPAPGQMSEKLRRRRHRGRHPKQVDKPNKGVFACMENVQRH